MRAFTKLTGVAAPLPMANVDTDKIIPARFLKTIKRTGLGVHLFDTLRYDAEGRERPDFVLNKEPWRKAEILIAHENFGCGSSREHAPWALYDYGFRAIIAPSFADIFYNNCCKNGLLPVTLPDEAVTELLAKAQAQPGYQLTVDLQAQLVTDDAGFRAPFTVDPFRRDCMLRGLDDIGLTLEHEPAIAAYEARRPRWRQAATVGR
jgi:3-isopropylmalate/(R)-2-methylmalate dehydratase small subunit